MRSIKQVQTIHVSAERSGEEAELNKLLQAGWKILGVLVVEDQKNTFAVLLGK